MESDLEISNDYKRLSSSNTVSYKSLCTFIKFCISNLSRKLKTLPNNYLYAVHIDKIMIDVFLKGI